MSKVLRTLSLAVVAISLSACYKVTVQTGLAPNGQTITKPWAHAFVGGLIPPATVETAQKCPTGVAKVESRLSFLNMLVGALTYSIYTPMEITVSCAGGGRSGGDDATLNAQGLSGAALEAVFNEALTKSQDLESAVAIRMR